MLEKEVLEKLANAHILTHPYRASIIKYLQNEGESDLSKISKALGISKNLVRFHILCLSNVGLVDNNFVQKNPKHFVQYFKVAPKGKVTIDFLTEYFKD